MYPCVKWLSMVGGQTNTLGSNPFWTTINGTVAMCCTFSNNQMWFENKNDNPDNGGIIIVHNISHELLV